MITLTLILVLGFLVFNIVKNNSIKKYNEEKKREAYEKKIKEEKEQRDEREHAQIQKELENLVDAIIKDWNASVYFDKVETPGNNTVTYKFENGNTIYFQGNTLIYKTPTQKLTYTIGIIYINKFRSIFNRIVEIINEGGTSKRYSYNNSYHRRYSDGGSTNYKTNTSNHKPKTSSSDPRTRRYEVIMETIKLRKENLAKMSKNDPGRAALENELKAAERKAMEIKKEMSIN